MEQDSPSPAGDTSCDVRGAQHGDAAATERVVRRLSPLLLADAAYRLRVTGLKEVDAEDVVAEAWAVALPKLGRIGERSGRQTPALLAFLSTTVRNVVGGLLRRRAVRGAVRRVDADASTTSAAEPAASDTGVSSRAAGAERRDLVLEAIERLEDLDREIVVLRGIEQRGNAETAELLSIAPTTAAMRFRRALDRLRAELPASVFDDIEDS